jgi:hypothetical protein
MFAVRGGAAEGGLSRMNTTRRLAAILGGCLHIRVSRQIDAELALTPRALVVAKRRIHPLACISLNMTVSEPKALEGHRPR